MNISIITEILCIKNSLIYFIYINSSILSASVLFIFTIKLIFFLFSLLNFVSDVVDYMKSESGSATPVRPTRKNTRSKGSKPSKNEIYTNDSDSSSSVHTASTSLQSSPGSSVSTRKSTKKHTDGVALKKVKTGRVYRFLCDICGFGTDIPSSVTNHYDTTHKQVAYVCEICVNSKKYSSQNGLRNHVKTVHMDKLSCQTCGKVFLYLHLLDDHNKQHTQKGSISCSLCFKTFTRVNDRDKHFRYRCPKNPNRVIICKHCDKEVEGCEQGLAQHLSKVHSLAGIFLCLFCHYLFATERKLDKHNENCTKKNPCPPK